MQAKRIILASLISAMLIGCGGGSSDGNTEPESPTSNQSPSINDTTYSLTVDEYSDFELEVDATDSDGSVANYKWEFVSGLTLEPENTDTSIFAFTAPAVQENTTATYELTVTDDEGATASAQYEFIIADEYDDPVADAGSLQEVATGSEVTLDGSNSSDSAQLPLSYSWSLETPSDSSAALSDVSTVSPTFTADVSGEYVASLTVNNGFVDSASSTVTIQATEQNAAPVAVIDAPDTAETSTTVSANSILSTDANGDELTYEWTLDAPDSSSSVLDSTTNSIISFPVDVEGKYTLSLTAYDGESYSETVYHTLTANLANNAPEADAGEDQLILLGETATVSASGTTDADGDPVSYTWSLTSAPEGSTATIGSDTTAEATLTADVAGQYVLTVTASDGEDSDSDSVIIEAQEAGLTLERKRSFALPGEGEYEEVGLPYSINSTVNATVSGSSSYVIDTFRLTGVGQDYTVTGVSATDANNIASVSFETLTGGQIIAADTPVEFELTSSLTNGQTADITFSFTISETGDTFTYNVLLTTNQAYKAPE